MSEISLIIEGQIFKAKKSLLTEYSDYFRAMFSGNYVENHQEEVKIDLVDGESMKAILNYMEIGLIDLTELSLTAIGDLAASANFLQITELIKQIEFTLDLQLSLSNWIQTLTIAEIATFTKLEKFAAAFGLLSFPSMKPKYIPSLHKLSWYLSHPYLNTVNEFSVFQFGLNWIQENKQSPDVLLIVLGCLDIKSLTRRELEDMRKCLKQYENSLASKISDCLLEILSRNWKLLPSNIIQHKTTLCELFTERVYNEVLHLVQSSTPRKLVLTPVVSISQTEAKLDKGPQFLYTFMGQAGFEQWIEVAEKILWGWSITNWGPNKLVVVGGEFGRGTGLFMREVAVWDTLRREWTHHRVQLPPRRHAGVTVIGDELYMIGGVGTYRVVLSSSVVYNLEERSFRKIQDFPDVIQNPPVCVHKGVLYVGGQKNIYKYHNMEEKDWWQKVLDTDIRANYMVSLEDHIYVTQNYFSHLFRFYPEGENEKLVPFSRFSSCVAAMCNIGKSIIAFTQTVCGQNELLTVEEYKDGEIKTLWSENPSSIQINDVAGCCALVLAIPPVTTAVSQYVRQHLNRFPDTDLMTPEQEHDINCTNS